MRKKDKVASSFCRGGLVDGGRGRGRGAMVGHFGDVDYVFLRLLCLSPKARYVWAKGTSSTGALSLRGLFFGQLLA